MFLSVPQTQREVEAKRKEEEKQEREKQQTIQRDLERQLEEAKEVRQREVCFLSFGFRKMCFHTTPA